MALTYCATSGLGSGNSVVLLVGSGHMAIEHSRVLTDLGVEQVVVGRGDHSASRFEQQTGVQVIRGGISSALASMGDLPPKAVVAVSVESLASTTMHLASSGVRAILTEKPAGLHLAELKEVQKIAEERGCRIYVAYNRRFYASVERARRIIEADGGVGTIWFDFTERAHVVESIEKPSEVLEKWFLANSTHVIDLAFDLAGEPSSLEARVAGQLEWHPSGSRFVGSGETVEGALFAYRADWQGPGGWGIEVTTEATKVILRPLETISVQPMGSTETERCDLDDEMDRRYKPGLYRQMQSFLGGGDGLLTLKDHVKRVEGPLDTMLNGGHWARSGMSSDS